MLSVVVSIVIFLLVLFVGFVMMFLVLEEVVGCICIGYFYVIGFIFLLVIVFGVIVLVLKGFFIWYEELKMKEELIEKIY